MLETYQDSPQVAYFMMKIDHYLRRPMRPHQHRGCLLLLLLYPNLQLLLLLGYMPF
jgi:hypothetical protein